MVSKKRVGILALQGDFSLHLLSLRKLGAEARLIKKPHELSSLDGLVIPGGESTTLLKLAEPLNLLAAIKKFAKNGGSVLGTCAGAILLAEKVVSPSQASLGLINITVERNGYGRQLDSVDSIGEATSEIGVINLPMTFIRAPRIIDTGDEVRVLASYKNDPVLVRQKNIIAATFHPELTDDITVYSYWLNLA